MNFEPKNDEEKEVDNKVTRIFIILTVIFLIVWVVIIVYESLKFLFS